MPMSMPKPALSLSLPLSLSVFLLCSCAVSTGMDPPDDTDADMNAPQKTDGGDPMSACDPAPPAATCPITLRYVPDRPPGAMVHVAGDWNAWSKTAQPLAGPDGQGAYKIELRLAPGLYAYKLVIGDTWLLDPGNGYRKYDGGIENSGLRVPDCNAPALRVAPGSVRLSRPGAGQGSFAAVLDHVPPASGRALCALRATLRSSNDAPGAPARDLSAAELLLSADRRSAEVRLSGLADGKYTVTLTPKSGDREGEPLLLPFWVEASAFRWVDSPIYMAMTDRFADGDPGNNPAPISGVEPTADYRGGDLLGIEKKIREGYFDERGVRALWITPWQTQPAGRFRDQSNKYWVSAYHGYWPIKAREVDPRLGGDAALRALVKEAHRHGIRVLMDAVLNHVHSEHEYFKDASKRSWFRTGCICGTANCDWTGKRLECLFADYMPDIDWTVTPASEQFIADTLWWMEHYDLDGLRIDAVKHVEDLAILNLGQRVRERFEQAGTRYYLLGETAMGWVDGSIAQNREQYDTIKRYMGPAALDGQFDFVLYHAVPYRSFARDDKRFLHVDYWTRASLDEFRGFDMVKYIGSHDTSRFITLATYRDQSPSWPGGTAHNKWDNLPLPPPDQEPYDRLYLALLNLLTTPGIPLLYYGDEYGEYGGGDPDNRHFMRFSGLSAREKALDGAMTAVLKARARLAGLRRGDLKTVHLAEDVYAYARPDKDPAGGALVVMNRTAAAQTVTLMVPAELGWAAGAKLADALAGAEYTLGGTTLTVTAPARGGLILSVK